MSLNTYLLRLGLQEYHEVLTNHGFKSWQDLILITEEDMARLNFKLGHRRKLQRGIANFKGKPSWEPLFHSSLIPRDSCDSRRSSSSSLLRRKYRRRPPKDPHAPKRPPSGYVLFANFLRQNPHVSNLPFIQIARLVGQQWHRLSSKERETWKSYAEERRSIYNIELSKYRKTEEYQRHQALLSLYKKSKGEHRSGHCQLVNSISRGSSEASSIAPSLALHSMRTTSWTDSVSFSVSELLRSLIEPKC